MLLKDPRVDVTLTDGLGRTPLWWASLKGYLGVAEWLIASGKDLGDVAGQKAHSNWDEDERMYNALDIAKEEDHLDIVTLLERFMTNPTQTRRDLRAKLGALPELCELAAQLFAVTVFHCDDLLQLKPAKQKGQTAAAARFFVIASKLPMELQMILCHRAVGSMKLHILLKDSEAAFKSLAQILYSSSK